MALKQRCHATPCALAAVQGKRAISGNCFHWRAEMITLFLHAKAKRIVLALCSLGILFPVNVLSQTRIRLGTLLPTGSSQYQALESMGQQWRASTGGSVTLTIYGGGTMGSEEDTVRRMRAGQLHAATLSAGGLSQIDPAIGAVQKIPMLY